MPDSLIIEDRSGVARPYTVTAAEAPPWAVRAYHLNRPDTGARYRLTEVSPGRWECSCPAYQCGAARRCKHTQTMEEMMSETNDVPDGAAAGTTLIERESGEREPDESRSGALTELARRTTDPNLAERKKLYWCNFPVSTPAGAALLLKCATPDLKPDDMIGKEFDLYGVYAAPVMITQEESGEIVPCLRTVLVLWGGRTLGFVSRGIADSLADLMVGHGQGPWNPPLRVRLRQIQIGAGKRLYRLELANDEAINDLFLIKQPDKTSAPGKGQRKA